MINTIVFDVDGTLYNETDPKMMAELSTTSYIHKCSGLSMELIYSTFRNVKAQIIKRYKDLPEANDRNKWYEALIKELSINNVKAEELSKYYWSIIYENMKPYADFMQVLPQLQKKYKLFVLTDELIDIHKQKLICLGLDNIFVKTVSSEQVGFTKPSEQLFEYLIKEIGEPKDNILMVGDNPKADIKGGNIVGINTAWLKRGKYHYYPQANNEHPNIEFTNYVQLIHKIDQL